MNRGSSAWQRLRAAPDRASMRPRFMNRGSAETRLERWESIVNASMRPRFMNRGSVIVALGLDESAGRLQ